ncbi:hypothetical protein K438DRAFT_2154636 [Mycena galopus ATCC 62051]|nr:hypothetical protein K438DRAFT_2154636 [Mycena galopus ATCC 62051]
MSRVYNLFCKAYDSTEFSSRLKAHLARHILGYKQAEKGVDAETAKMSWVHGQTYNDTYAPALPRKASYRADEVYDPIWRNVRVPEAFLKLCGAALLQKCPNSIIFKLPALANRHVQNWMKTDFPTQLSVLQASIGNPIDFARIESDHLRIALEELRAISNAQWVELKKMRELLERRTAVLSPAQGFSTATYYGNDGVPPASPLVIHLDEHNTETGTYRTEDDDLPIRAFVNPRPATPNTPRATKQVDLVLSPTAAFYRAGEHAGLFPPLLGQKSALWPDVFACIRWPEFCSKVWGPDKTVEQFASIDDLWTAYSVGEPICNEAGIHTGVKPPIQLVEQYFHAAWRTDVNGDKAVKKTIQKQWERFREIPEWIATSCDRRHVSPLVIISELDAMRENGGKTKKGLNWLRNHLVELRKARAQESSVSELPSASSSSTNESTIAMQDVNNQGMATAPVAPALGPAFVLHEGSAPCKRARAVDARRAVSSKKAKI